jgi:hypothetical protein
MNGLLKRDALLIWSDVRRKKRAAGVGFRMQSA